MKHQLLFAALCLVPLVSTLGCVYDDIAYIASERYEPRPLDHPIEVITGVPARPHIALASISVEGAPWATRESVLERLKERIREMGGDAIINYYAFEAPPGTEYAGSDSIQGTAVRWAEPGTGTQAPGVTVSNRYTQWDTNFGYLILDPSADDLGIDGYFPAGRENPGSGPLGRLHGIDQGDGSGILEGEWWYIDTEERGCFRLYLADDERSFTGTWGHGDSYDSDGEWNGEMVD